MMMSEFSLSITGDTVTLQNQNTTIGYARFSRELKSLEYIFVHPSYRRLGIGSSIVRHIENEIGIFPEPEGPISRLGSMFFRSLTKNFR